MGSLQYYWVVPTSHRQPKVEIRFDIVKDFDREEAKKAVANGLTSAESVAEQEKKLENEISLLLVNMKKE